MKRFNWMSSSRRVAVTIGNAPVLTALFACIPFVASVICGATILATSAANAYGQSIPSPFTGTWHGELTYTSQDNRLGAIDTCSIIEPWSGTIDSTGLLTAIMGQGRGGSCTLTPIGFGPPFPWGFVVPSDGYVPSLHRFNSNCVLSARFSASPSLSASGALSNCSYTVTRSDGTTYQATIVQASFTGSGVPLAFPMTVTSNIGTTVSSATANIQFRPQDVGTSGSVFTFAIAPSTITKSASADDAPLTLGFAKTVDGRKDTSVACVLAQLNSSGQLQAVSVANLQAYVSGVLSSQGQAVTILNNVATINVSGAVFYVGYGSNATSMISGNIINRAVSVPGTLQCNPQAPQTGWWWNPQESGRGFSIEVSGNNLFMATYLYDASGRSTWYVATGPTSIDGSLFSGQLLAFGGGVTLNGPYRSNSPLASAGAVSLVFGDAQNGTLIWPGGTVTLQRFPFGANGTATASLPNQPRSGWWWGGANDTGRGFFMEWQGNQAFLAGYMYDEAGNATWYVSQASVADPRSFSSSWLQFANGQTLTGAYRPATLVNGNVAPVTIEFQTADSAILTLPSGTLPITRFRF